MSDPTVIYETDVVDYERERYTAPACCDECGALVTVGDLTEGLCWTCHRYLRYDDRH